MASPVFESAGTGTQTAQDVSVTVTAPTGIADDDLLIAVVDVARRDEAVTLSGWTELTNASYGGGRVTVLTKIASSESGNYTFGWTNSSRAAAGIIRVSGADTTTPIIGTTPTWATGTSTTPDPPASATVTSGDYLFVAIIGQQGPPDGRFSASPTNYTERVDVGSGTGGTANQHCGIGVFTRALTATNDNPGTATSAGNDDWAAQTIIVAPAAAAGFTGTVAATLAAATSTATGTVTEPAITGTATPTLGAATATASGTHTPPGFTGSVAVTLGAATSTATGTVTEPAITGTATPILQAATSTASGTNTPPGFSGTAAVTLGAATATATGAVGLGGTQLYFQAGATPAITPAFDAGWDVTGSAQQSTLQREPQNTTLTNYTQTETSTTPQLDLLIGQYVYGPLPAFTLSGEVHAQIAMIESSPNMDGNAQICIRVIAPGGTVRGTALALDTASSVANEFATSGTGTNRYFPVGSTSSTLSSVAVTEGDYLVIEIGARVHNTFSNSFTATARIGDRNTDDDLPIDESTLGNSYRPWIEFSQNLPAFITADPFEDALVASAGGIGPTHYYRLDESSGDLIDIIGNINLPTDGGTSSPTYSQSGPYAGWSALTFDGVDDYARQTTVRLYEGPGAVLGWAKAADTTQVHGELWWLSLGGGTYEGGHGFEMRDLGGGRKWDLHYLDETLNGNDLQGETPDSDWHAFAVTADETNGFRFWMVESGVVTLKGTDVDTTQLAFQLHGLATDQNVSAFADFDISRLAIWKGSGLSQSELQTIVDAAQAITGTVGVTLASATSTASGTVSTPAISGTVGVTLGAATSTTSATVTEPPITGTIGVTLGAATGSASGTNTPSGFSGSVAVTLGAATSSASGTVIEPPITGTVGVTLGAATATASGSAGVDAATGNINVTLAAATASASGTVTEPAITGTVAVTLEAATGSANGLNVLDITGTITVTLAAATATAAGTTVAPYWWEYNPVLATTSTPAHTKTPVSYTKIHGDDQSPW